MKKRLRKNKKYFNFYEFQVKHGFNHRDIYDLIIPSQNSDWEYLGYGEQKGVYIYRHRPVDYDNKELYAYLDEIQLASYIGKYNIDFILRNSMCLSLKNDLTKGGIRYV